MIFYYYWVLWVLYISWILTFYPLSGLQIFFFPHSIFCHLVLLMVSLVIQNFWVWYSPICLFFMCWFWCHNQKIFARAILRRFLPMIYIRVSHFHVLGLSLQSISIWNLWVVWDRSLISFFCCGYQFFLSPFFEEILHSSWNILVLLSNTDWLHIQGFNPRLSALFHWSRYAFLCQYHSFILLL